jgi:hypothetical protein
MVTSTVIVIMVGCWHEVVGEEEKLNSSQITNGGDGIILEY